MGCGPAAARGASQQTTLTAIVPPEGTGGGRARPPGSGFAQSAPNVRRKDDAAPRRPEARRIADPEKRTRRGKKKRKRTGGAEAVSCPNDGTKGKRPHSPKEDTAQAVDDGSEVGSQGGHGHDDKAPAGGGSRREPAGSKEKTARVEEWIMESLARSPGPLSDPQLLAKVKKSHAARMALREDARRVHVAEDVPTDRSSEERDRPVYGGLHEDKRLSVPNLRRWVAALGIKDGEISTNSKGSSAKVLVDIPGGDETGSSHPRTDTSDLNFQHTRGDQE
eukprot:TRINITY_DN10016_c0_g1_i1.p1 TRINITY_DN10016_c0_g1~~TRINITY_DN10016_c0_g1_i1.p1  ORF type:complete len:278 (+),score=10.38 TRINITY_DN10016_c0_g1_i1:167-1000(+)